jgi:hypothetical protein
LDCSQEGLLADVREVGGENWKGRKTNEVGGWAFMTVGKASRAEEGESTEEIGGMTYMLQQRRETAEVEEGEGAG